MKKKFASVDKIAQCLTVPSRRVMQEEEAHLLYQKFQKADAAAKQKQVRKSI